MSAPVRRDILATMGGDAMAGALRVAVEAGPKGRRFVAHAPDWPGLERGGKSEDEAINALVAYLPRYAVVAQAAGLGSDLPSADEIEIAERFQGTGSTDFWGISFGFSAEDHTPLPAGEVDRSLRIVQACWTVFDDVSRRVSAELRLGSRGGGRSRDRIVQHVRATEQHWGTKVGIKQAAEVVVDDESTAAFRERYLDAIRQFAAEGRPARTWPLRYLIRHTGYHTMDHAWEMEDRDLST